LILTRSRTSHRPVLNTKTAANQTWLRPVHELHADRRHDHRSRPTMTLTRSRIAWAILTLATIALLLYTIGAPYEHGG